MKNTTYTLDEMKSMVQDWFADHAEEMADLVVDWPTYNPSEASVEAEDSSHSYLLSAVDGDIYINTVGAK